MEKLLAVVQPQSGTVMPPHPLEDGRLNLYAWQEEAFQAWGQTGHVGIVEAVTGAGKTRLGLAAASMAIREGRRVLLLVPTIELLHQWFGEVRELLPWVKVGRLGDQYRDDFSFHEMIVSTVQSALAINQTRSVNILSGNESYLLIADEVHRLAGDQFSRTLDSSYPWRLGLSATYERPDDKHLEHLDPYFGGVIYRLWYERAKADHLIAPFDVALIGVDLTDQEYSQYQSLSDDISRTHRSLLGYFPNGDIRGQQFLVTVASWAAEETMSARSMLAKKYMRAVAARQRLLAETQVKLQNLALLSPALRRAHSSLIFSLTQQGAQDAAALVNQHGVSATAVFSEMPGADRSQQMKLFRQGDLPVLAAPRVLDEGVDVPEAELGIVLAANRSKRQLVQRLGRVIRRKLDGRAGKFVFFYANGTIEDPEISGDEHLNEILPHARELGWFELPDDISKVLTFLENEPPTEAQPSPKQGHFPKVTPRVREGQSIRFSNQKSIQNSGEKSDAVEEPLHRSKLPPPVAGNNPQNPPDTSGQEEVEIEDWDGEVPERLKGVAFLGRDSTHLYLKQIGKFALLTAAEEVELGKEIECGLFAQEKLSAGDYQLRRERRELETLVTIGAQAHRRFMYANLRLVVSVAKRYASFAGTLDFLDLVQEGNLGLERALQKWDFTLGNKFSTYAMWWIQQGITRAMADTSRTIRIPVHKVEELRKAQSLRAEAELFTDTQTAEAWVAEDMGLSLSKLADLFRLDLPPIDFNRPVWLIEPGHIQEVTFGDKIIDEYQNELDDELLSEELSLHVMDAMRTLTSREEEVIRMRFGIRDPQAPKFDVEPMTLDAIGAEFGLTRERIRQIEKQAKSKLFRTLKARPQVLQMAGLSFSAETA